MTGTSRITLLSAALALLGAAASLGAGNGNAPVGYEIRSFPSIKAHVVTVNLASPRVSIKAQLASGGPGSSESFRSMLRRTRPVAAITGAFFDTRSHYPVGDIAVDGQWVHKGVVGNGVCITSDGQVRIVPRYEGRSTGWTGYQTVICGGPMLVRDNKIVLSPASEGFSDGGLFGRNRRTAVGHTVNNKLVLVAINKPISLRRLALIMKDLGCKDAITMDGGSSTGLWFNGSILARPGRSLTNLLAVHVSPPQPVPESVVKR